jgi:hypothetical protein
LPTTKEKEQQLQLFASGVYLHGMVSFDGQVPKKINKF